MRKYYFSDLCLKVYDDALLEKRLALFKIEQPYINEISLHILHNDASSVPVICAESGIEIGSFGDGWRFSSADKNNFCAIRASSDYSALECLIDEDAKDRERSEENALGLLRLAIESNLSYHNGVSLHASCVVYDDKAVLFTAPSGVGKSTQAEIWRSCQGAAILNGDRPCLRVDQTAGVRAYGVPWDGKERIFRPEHYPAAAIIEVRRGAENSLRKLSRAQAFRLLMQQTFIPAWDDTAKFLVIQTLRTIARTVPFYRLFCLPEREASELVRNIVYFSDHILLKESGLDMKIKDGFILKNLVGEWIVMPKGNNIKSFDSAIVLNEIAAFIWKQLESPVCREDLIAAVLNEYEIDEKTAAGDIDRLIEKLDGLGILEKETGGTL